jgi:hypothetical protein
MEENLNEKEREDMNERRRWRSGRRAAWMEEEGCAGDRRDKDLK